MCCQEKSTYTFDPTLLLLIFKGKLMQIWKSANRLRLRMKIIVEDFILKHLLLSETCACEICEKFVYKLSETIESTF